MTRTLLLWPALVAGLFFAPAALAQVSPPLPEAQGAGSECEFHVWPGSNLRSVYSGWLHGGIVDGAVNGREGYNPLPPDPLPPGKQLNELRQMVREERDSFSRGDRGAGIRLSGEFHLKLAEAAGNAPLVSFQRSLVSQTSLIIAQYESGNRSHCSYDEHTQLIDAIEARDATLAVDLMMHHMDHIDSKLNLDEESASDDLHAVFSHLLQTKKPGRSSVKL